MATKKILFVEDNNIEREMYQHQLEKTGYSISVASNGPDAVTLALNDGYDLVILDILLPGFDGFHVLEKLKADPKTQNIPVIILTNLDQDKFLQRSMKHGAAEYLIKSMTTPAHVVTHIKSLLEVK